MLPLNTRIAPSPTGFIHLGNIRTAYHNWLAARSTGGKFILRIDDTDKERNQDEYIDKIYDVFNWLGLDYDETFKQSERYDRHLDLVQKLLYAGLAEYVDDTSAVRLKEPNIRDHWTDKVAGTIKVSQKDRDVAKNIIIYRSNDTPTYNFASIVDDIDSGVNMVIRGTDHISNTIKQLAIIDALVEIDPAFETACEFAHVGLVFEKGAKLSKRSGNSNLDLHRSNNVNPEAILNWILRLGWSPSDANFDSKHPIITKDHAKQIFWSEGNLRNAPSSLDLNKLAFLNKKHNQKK